MSSANKLLPQWSTAQHPILIRVLWFKKLHRMQLFSPFGPAWTRLLRQCIDDIAQCWEWQVDLCTCRDSAVDRLKMLSLWESYGSSSRNDWFSQGPPLPKNQTTHHYRSKIGESTPSFKRSPVAPENWGFVFNPWHWSGPDDWMHVLNISWIHWVNPSKCWVSLYE